MRIFQYIMYGFYVVLLLAATGIGVWFYKKKKEGDQ
jgi:hypothetical protein